MLVLRPCREEWTVLRPYRTRLTIFRPYRADFSVFYVRIVTEIKYSVSKTDELLGKTIYWVSAAMDLGYNVDFGRVFLRSKTQRDSQYPDFKNPENEGGGFRRGGEFSALSPD